MKRVPVHVVAGAPGSGISALVARLMKERSSTWTALTPSSVSALSATPSIVGNDVKATGADTNGDLYTVTMNSLALAGVTGFRMDVLPGPNGYIGFTSNPNPANAPATNGNAVLEEFQVSVPEPASLALLGLGLAGLGFSRRKGASRSV